MAEVAERGYDGVVIYLVFAKAAGLPERAYWRWLLSGPAVPLAHKKAILADLTEAIFTGKLYCKI